MSFLSRLSLAWHVLRGGPAIIGITFYSPVEKDALSIRGPLYPDLDVGCHDTLREKPHLRVHGCHFIAGGPR
jgi:hypothetical protein